MKRIMNYELKIKLVIIFLALFIIHYSLFVTSVSALDSTPSASPSASIQQKIQQLQIEIASKAAQIKQEISKKLQNKAYIGFLKTKSDKTLTLATLNSSKIISINEDTVYSGKNKLSIKTLETEDYLAALGDIDETQVLTAKKIIKLIPPKEERVIVSGTVVSTLKQIIIQNKETNITFKVNSDTLFLGQKATLNSGDKIIAVVLNSKDESLARTVYIFPSPQAVEVTPESTKSATTSGKKIN